MGKFISNLFLGALAIGLSIFTASRTLDLLAWALPVGQVIYQWLGLAAFEGGMYFWSFYFVNGAKGTPQRSISVIMAVFSIVAVAVATIADLSLDAGQAGKVAPLSPAMQQAMIVFLGVVIAFNVAAFLACKLMSIENLRNIKEGQAEDKIYDEGLRAISSLAPSMASAAAPYLAQEWANRTWDRIVPGARGRTEYLGPVGAPVPALPAGSPVALPREEQASHRPVPAPAPVPAQPAPASRPRKLLGFIPLPGGSPAPAPAPVPVNGPAPSEKTSNQLYREEMRLRRASQVVAPTSAVAAARRARRQDRLYRRTTEQIPAPEPVTEEMPAPRPEPVAVESSPAPAQKKARPARAKK